MELRSDRSARLGQIALLDFEIAFLPVLGKDLPFRVVQYPLAPQIIEETGDAVP